MAYGYFLAEVMPALDASACAHTIVTKLVGLILAGMLIVLIMQMRQDVANKIRGDASRVIGQVRERVADVWHLFAILYVIATCGVWALEISGGFDYVLRSTAISLMIIVASNILYDSSRMACAKVFQLAMNTKYGSLDWKNESADIYPL